MVNVIILFLVAVLLLVLAVVMNKKKRDQLSGWLLAFAIMAAGGMLDELVRWLLV